MIEFFVGSIVLTIVIAVGLCIGLAIYDSGLDSFDIFMGIVLVLMFCILAYLIGGLILGTS